MNSGDRKVYVIFFLILFLGFLSTLLLMVFIEPHDLYEIGVIYDNMPYSKNFYILYLIYVFCNYFVVITSSYLFIFDKCFQYIKKKREI